MGLKSLVDLKRKWETRGGNTLSIPLQVTQRPCSQPSMPRSASCSYVWMWSPELQLVPRPCPTMWMGALVGNGKLCIGIKRIDDYRTTQLDLLDKLPSPQSHAHLEDREFGWSALLWFGLSRTISSASRS